MVVVVVTATVEVIMVTLLSTAIPAAADTGAVADLEVAKEVTV